MSNPLVHAFFVGRALAEVVNEQLERGLTNLLSEVGKFDAEQRERLRHFSDRVLDQANHEAESVDGAGMSFSPSSGNASSARSQPVDLQATLDDLRAEIARLRAELQIYRSKSGQA